MAQVVDVAAGVAKEKKGYGEGDAYERNESPSKVKDPSNGRSDRSEIVKSAASAYRKKSENDAGDAPGRGQGAGGKRHMKYGR